MESFDTKLLKLSRVFSDEQVSFSYILRRLQKRQRLVCPSCWHEDFYLMSRYRLKCRLCRKEFRPLAKTKFSLLNISCADWLAVIKLFESGSSARRAASRVKPTYKTVLKAYHIIRHSIVEMLLRQNPFFEDGGVNGDSVRDTRDTQADVSSRKGTQVFGILRNVGEVSVRVLRDLSPEIVMEQEIGKVRQGSIVYTDRWQQYDTVVFIDGDRSGKDDNRNFGNKEVYVDSVDGFWRFARERLLQKKADIRDNFIYYIKEMEWRYNNRTQNLFDLIVDYLLVLNVARQYHVDV